MNDIFITNIHVKQSRNISNFDIPLSQEKRSHLILTGKNGSGKTSLLMDLWGAIMGAWNASVGNTMQIWNYFQPLISDNVLISLSMEHVNQELIKQIFANGTFIIKYFDAKRPSNDMIAPAGIQTIRTVHSPSETACGVFLQYIVNLKAERSFAKDDNDIASSQKIDAWFDRFLQRLRKLFQSPELELEFDRKNYNFLLKEKEKSPYTFTQLSDGFSAVFTIISEIIMRMEGQSTAGYDRQGIVLIDEIETHLHVSLQKEIMPLLIDFFPNIQFIVTTHSPFVISSIENAVICDLEHKTVLTDLSAYSYDGIVEYYYNSDKYSEKIKTDFENYKSLINKHDRDDGENTQLIDVITYLKSIPAAAAPELIRSFRELELQRRSKNGQN
jgi:predicted ATPase